MKRIIISLAIVTVILIGSFYSIRSVETRTKSIINEIEKSNVDTAYEEWERGSFFYGVLFRHNELDEIELLFLRIKNAEEQQDENTRFYVQHELINALQKLNDITIPTARNII